MSQPELVKVYAGFRPAGRELYEALSAIARLAHPAENASLKHCGEICSLSFEGLYFPLDDALEAIRLHAPAAATGRLDYLDLENWRLCRYELSRGKIAAHCADLNHVLDYSGF